MRAGLRTRSRCISRTCDTYEVHFASTLQSAAFLEGVSMATKVKTDYDYALAHKYRTVSGGKFVPGVTTIINVNDKPALKWAAAEIAAQSVIENWRKKTTIIKKHREWLCNSRGNTD